VKWIKTARANHYLDAEALASAAGHLLNVHLIRDPSSAQPATTSEPKSPKPVERVSLTGGPRMSLSSKGWITDF